MTFNGKPEFYEYFADCTPALVSPPLEPFGKPMERYWGACVPLQIMAIEGIRARYYIPREATLRTGRHVVGRLLSEKGLFERAVEDFGGCQRRLEAVFGQVQGLDVEQVLVEELLALERQLNDAFTACYVPGYFVEPAYFFLEHQVRERLMALLEALGREKEYSGFFVDLTPIAGEPAHVAEDKGLLEILALVEARPEAKRLFLQKPFHAAALKTFAEIWGRLEGHARRFFWINNGYASTPYLDVAYFAGQLREKIVAGVSAGAKLEEYRKKERQRKEARDRALSTLEIPRDLEALLDLVGKVAYFQDLRKRAMLQAVHYSNLLLAHIASRYDIPQRNLLFALPRELTKKNLSRKEFPAILESRSRRCLILYGYAEWRIFDGQEAKAKETELLGPQNAKIEGVSPNVMGTCASLGYAVGRAKVVLTAADIPKVQKGDVLVARSTRPEYVPAMKRACAIVTDEGGITSHAAIVSRELGVPCVIGTKVATLAFKDGDYVEVNANHGIVRKIQEGKP